MKFIPKSTKNYLTVGLFYLISYNNSFTQTPIRLFTDTQTLTLRTNSQYINFICDTTDGIVLNCKWNFKKSTPNDLYQVFLDNKLICSGKIVNGVQNDTWEYFDSPQHYKKKKIVFKNGIIDGACLIFENSGAIKYELYSNGMVNGFSYRMNVKKELEELTYTCMGELIILENYNNNVLTERFFYDYNAVIQKFSFPDSTVTSKNGEVEKIKMPIATKFNFASKQIQMQYKKLAIEKISVFYNKVLVCSATNPLLKN